MTKTDGTKASIFSTRDPLKACLRPEEILRHMITSYLHTNSAHVRRARDGS